MMHQEEQEQLSEDLKVVSSSDNQTNNKNIQDNNVLDVELVNEYETEERNQGLVSEGKLQTEELLQAIIVVQPSKEPAATMEKGGVLSTKRLKNNQDIPVKEDITASVMTAMAAGDGEPIQNPQQIRELSTFAPDQQPQYIPNLNLVVIGNEPSQLARRTESSTSTKNLNNLNIQKRMQMNDTNIAVQVKTIKSSSRKGGSVSGGGQRYNNSRRIQAAKKLMNQGTNQNAPRSNVAGVSPPPSGAQYAGSAVSPHIKQEYLQTRIKSPANVMRAKKIGSQRQQEQIPIIQGQSLVVPPLPQKPGTMQQSRRQQQGQHNYVYRQQPTTSSNRSNNTGGAPYDKILGFNTSHRSAGTGIEDSDYHQQQTHISQFSQRQAATSSQPRAGDAFNKDIIMTPDGFQVTSQNNLLKQQQQQKIYASGVVKGTAYAAGEGSNSRPVHIELNLMNKQNSRTKASYQNEPDTVKQNYADDTLPGTGKKLSAFNRLKRQSTGQIQAYSGQQQTMSLGSNTHVQLTDFLANNRKQQVENDNQNRLDTVAANSEQDNTNLDQQPPQQNQQLINSQNSINSFEQNVFNAGGQVAYYPQSNESPTGGLMPKLIDSKQQIINIANTAGSQHTNDSKYQRQPSLRLQTHSLQVQQQNSQTVAVGEQLASPQTGVSLYKKQNIDKARFILTVPNAETKYITDENQLSGEFSQTIKEQSQMTNIGNLSVKQHQPPRHKSVMNHGSNASRLPIQMISTPRQSDLPQSHTNLEGTQNDFSVVAKTVTQVRNDKVYQARWERKRNTMSKNEMDRQSTLLQNLPFITKQRNFNQNETNTRSLVSPKNVRGAPAEINTDINDYADKVYAAAQDTQQDTQELSPLLVSPEGTPSIQEKFEQINTTIMTTHHSKLEATILDHDRNDMIYEANGPSERQSEIQYPAVQNQQKFQPNNGQFNSQIIYQNNQNQRQFTAQSGGTYRINTSHGGTRINPYRTGGLQEYGGGLNVTKNGQIYNPSNYNANNNNAMLSQETFNISRYQQGKQFRGNQTDRSSYVQQWGEGKPTVTSSLVQNQTTASKLSKYFNRRAQSKSTTGHNAMAVTSGGGHFHKKHKSTQRQIKGLLNLGEFKSTNISGIKVSHMNDLANVEDGNPLAQIKKAQIIKNKYASTQPTGGVNTLHLAQFNAEAKFQVEAIQDFTCKQSLYNKTQVFKDQCSRMPLKNLVGNQKILLPQKLQDGDYSVMTDTNNQNYLNYSSRNAAHQMSVTNDSHQSAGDVTVTQMQVMLNKSKVCSTRKSTNVDYVKEKDFKNTSILADDDQDSCASPRRGDKSDRSDKNAVDTISPSITQAKIHSKQYSLQKKKQPINEIPLRSWRNEQPNSLEENTIRGFSRDQKSKQMKSFNKDMEELLVTKVPNITNKIIGAAIMTDNFEGNTDNGQLPLDTECVEQIDSRRKASRLSHHSPNKMNTKGDNTSDENDQNSPLYPTGILDITKTPESVKSHSKHVKLISSFANNKSPQMQEDEEQSITNNNELVYDEHSPKKQQVFSHLDSESPRRKNESLPYPDNDTTLTHNFKNQSELTNKNLLEKQDDEDYSPTMIGRKTAAIQNNTPMQDTNRNLNVDQQSSGNEEPGPIMGVTQVKIQKTKSSMQREELYGIGEKKKSNEAIRHVDQSAEQVDEQLVMESQQTVVRISYRDSLEQQTPGDQIQKKLQQTYNRSLNTMLNKSFENEGQPSRQADSGSLQQINAPLKDASQKVIKTNTLDEIEQTKENLNVKIRQKSDALEYPSVLNLISKKTTPDNQVQPRQNKSMAQTNKDRSRSIEQSLQVSQQQTDILEQLNNIPNMLGNQHNGYHQLEPKIFQTNTRAFDQARNVPAGMPMVTVSRTNTQNGGNRPFNSKQKNSTTGTTMSPEQNQQVSAMQAFLNQNQATLQDNTMTSARHSYLGDEEEMGYISHRAIENKFRGARLSRQIAEKMKLEKAQPLWKKTTKQNKQESQIQSDYNYYSTSLNSSHKGNNYKQQSPRQKTKQSFNSNKLNSNQHYSINEGSMFNSHMAAIISKDDGDHNKRTADLRANFDIRKLQPIEKSFKECINIEQLLGQPIERINQTLNSLVDAEVEEKNEVFEDHVRNSSNPLNMVRSLTQEVAKSAQLSFKRMSSKQVTYLYRDNFQYEFMENELYRLLGEQVSTDKSFKPSRRYFMKFTSMQIINIDCQSGVISDMKPLSIPMSKMVNLFFLSKDQLQKVIGQSLYLCKQNNQIRLKIDYNQLREMTYSTQQRNIRDDYFSAPLTINLVENDSAQNFIKDSFKIGIRMPRFEIITTAQEVNQLDMKEVLYKTTTTHYLTGKQMIELLKVQNLINWQNFAKKLVQQRFFGVDHAQRQQIQADSAIVKLQRLDKKNELVLYRDPQLIAQAESTAQNLQLTLMMQQKLIFQVHFQLPLLIKLQIDADGNGTNRKDKNLVEEHLPGYLTQPQKMESETVARVTVPFSKYSLIKDAFGDKINEGEGSFLECLYQTILVHIDPHKNICRLNIPSWKQLEDLNVRTMGQMYYFEQQTAKQMAQEHLKYLKKTAKSGGVKEILSEAAKKPSENNVFKHPIHEKQPKSTMSITGAGSTQPAMMTNAGTSSLIGGPIIQTQDDIASAAFAATNSAINHPKQKRIELNNSLLCKLKISNISKVIYNSEFSQAGGQLKMLNKESNAGETIEKMTLAEYNNQRPTYQ